MNLTSFVETAKQLHPHKSVWTHCISFLSVVKWKSNMLCFPPQGNAIIRCLVITDPSRVPATHTTTLPTKTASGPSQFHKGVTSDSSSVSSLWNQAVDVPMTLWKSVTVRPLLTECLESIVGQQSHGFSPVEDSCGWTFVLIAAFLIRVSPQSLCLSDLVSTAFKS